MKFLMFLGICDLDRDGHVVLRDSSALPQVEGKGGSAWVIQEQEAAHTVIPVPTSDSSDICSVIEGTTLDLKSVTPSVVEFRVHPSMVEMELEVSISESSIYVDSFDYGYSSNYGYMDNINKFESEDFMTASEKEARYQYQCCDQLKEGLETSHSSGSESEPECIVSGLIHSQESKLEIGGSVYGNPPFKSKPQVTPEFEPSNLCTVNQVLVKDSPQAEGKGGVAQVDEAFRTATSVLIEFESTCSLSINTISHDPEYETAEGLVDWNLEDSSALPDLSESTGMSSAQCLYEETMSTSWIPFDSFRAVDSTLDYDYM